jgi:hypothetical protein
MTNSTFDRASYRWLTLDAIDLDLPAGCRMAVHCIANRTGALTLLAFQDTGPGSLGADSKQVDVVMATAGDMGGRIEQLRDADITPEIAAALVNHFHEVVAVLPVHRSSDGRLRRTIRVALAEDGGMDAAAMALFIGVDAAAVRALPVIDDGSTFGDVQLPAEWFTSGQRRSREAQAHTNSDSTIDVLNYWARRDHDAEVEVVDSLGRRW